MVRLFVIGLLAAGAFIGVVIAHGPGRDKPEEPEKNRPEQQATKVSSKKEKGEVQNASTETTTAPVGATIVMRGLRFEPESATLRAGQSVRFVNKDTTAHTIIQDVGARSGIAASIDSGRILPGEAFTFVARKPDKIAFVCELHPTVMTGKLTVTGANS
jgi:plastocyanin